MASQVPIGYNPETSLLQGGTAPIVPVQGGGGMEAGAAPPGYNPDQSMLNTPNNAPIVAVRGGGDEKEKAYEGFVLEHYEPPLEMIEIPEIPEKGVRRALITRYITASLPDMKEVQRLDTAPTTFAFVDEVAPTYQKCSTEGGTRRLPLNFFETVRKRIVLIDDENPVIWIIPNLKGNVSLFIQYMNQIPRTDDGKIAPSHYVFFVGSFFSFSNKQNNLLLYHQFLLMKLANMKNIYYLNNLNDDFVSASCDIVKSIYSIETLRSPDGQEKPLSAFFEPDIVVFTNVHIVLKNSELPVQREDNRVKVSKLLTLPNFTSKSFLIVPSRDTYDDLPSDDSDAPLDKRYFFLAFNRNVVKQIKRPASTIQCPKGQTCSGFLGGFKLVDAGDDRKIETPGLYALYANKDGMPLLKEPGSKLEVVPSAAVAKPPARVVPPPVPDTKPSVPSKPEEEEEEEEEEEPIEKPKDEPFVPSPTAVSAKQEQTIEVNNKEYKIRVPFEKAIKENWLEGVYSEGEVALLQDLQFTPRLLSDTFGTKHWKPRLADFLEKIVLSNCFHDTTLLTKRECSNSQVFVKEIYLRLYSESLEKLSSQFGYPKPEVLEDILLALKRIAALGPAKAEATLTKYGFRGDLLNRFRVIHYDKKTGEYSTDFAVVPEEVRKALEALKFYRVSDRDLNEVTRAILEYLKIPVPPRSEDLYSIAEFQDSILPIAMFDKLHVEPDGLCFYRAVLKGLEKDPKADKVIKDEKISYEPDTETSLQFVKNIKEYLREHKKEIFVAGLPVEEWFNSKYAHIPGEEKVLPVPVSDTEKERRIRTGTNWKRMNFDEFLGIMDSSDPTIFPWAEVFDAGIGTVAGKVKNRTIVIYVKEGEDHYKVKAIFNAQEGKHPIESYVFLFFVNDDHYDLLRLKKGVSFPHAPTGMKGGEILDLGEPVASSRRRTQKKRRVE